MKSTAAAAKPDPNAAAASKIDLTWAIEGQSVWVMLPEDDPSGEACLKGTIVKLIDDENAQVQVEGAKEPKNYRGDKIYPLNNYKDYPDGYDDMVDMENLSEAELLNNLRIRFLQEMIYTYVGPTLIVANPYKRIDKLLKPEILSNFHKRLLAGNFEQKENMPHVYAISATAMRNMFENYKNQAIVISGESGAGKTENTKSAMKFLTSLGKSEADANASNTENIEDKILACNPILEAFGNAKTVRNDNSSRFGKYVALLVDKGNRKIVGATITNYLLEKSRVVGQVSEERNYHIFYAFLRGAPEDLLKKYFVTSNLDDWEYTKKAFKGEVKTVPDLDLYKEVTDSFNTMKFSDAEIDAIWTYTAASLMVGNLEFDESSFNDTTPCKFKNEQILKNAVKILNIDYDQFAKAIRFRTRVVAGSAIDSTMKREECLVIRDSLAKELYNKLFNWLVKRLNYTVMPSEFTQGGLDTVALMNKYFHIGLLDIFGFEIFNFNSIEQFCINFSNEKLQQLYIAYVFKGEEKEFINEGLKEFLGELNFKDNQGLIDMLDHAKLPGIFQMVDESCTVAATDQALYDKIVKQFKKPEFPLATPKMAKDTFIVKHTAKEVEYNINGFRAKNKDEISKTIEDAVCTSKTRDIVNVWKCLCFDEKESEDAKKPNPKDKFLGYKFRAQMKELMDELNSCECHFIRCIKPNEVKKADFFLPQLVLQQIKYMGILDTIKVRKDSFPIRTPYKAFYEKYQELDKKASKTPFAKHVEDGADFKEMTKAICSAKVPHLGTKELLYGNTKLFLRVEAAKEIEKIRREWEKFKSLCAKRIQRAWYRYKHLKILRAMFGGVRVAQKLYRIKREHQLFLKKRRLARRIQKWWKNILWKRKAERIKKFVMRIQKWWKMVFQRAKYLKIVDSSKTINRLIRGGKARKTARGLRVSNAIIEEILRRGVDLLMERVRIAAAIVIQKYARGYICRQRMKEEIERIKKAKEDFVYNKNATIIQKNARAFIVRNSFTRLYNAAVFIQGYMKMRWLSTLFQRLRNVSIKIQKAVKKWYLRRKAINDKNKHYMNTEGKAYQSLQIAEQANFFGIHNLSKVGKPTPRDLLLASKLNGNQSQLINESVMNTTQAVHHNVSQRSYMMSETLKTQSIEAAQYESLIQGDETLQDYIDFKQHTSLNTPREFDPYGAKKIQVFTKLIDVDVMSDTSLLYDPMWSLQVLQLQNDCNAAGTDIQVVEVGQAHTTVVPSTGKLYSFGWNDYFQLGRPTQPDEHISSCSQISLPVENFRPKAIASGDDHNLVLDYQGNLYIWGDNSKGQLGLGHCRQTSRITILDFLSNDSLQEIRAKGNNSLVVTQTGKVFAWPIQLTSGEKIYRPAELCLPPKITISTTACGYNFAVLVAKNGLVFTFGRDNQFGQLGQGDTEPRDTPTLVDTLKNENEIAVNVSCGFKHVICKTKLGRVYTWGWGGKGQLGHGDFEDLSKPKMVNLNQNGSKAKVLQAQAGFKHSVVILDNKKLLWWGSNASLDCQPTPVEVNLHKKIPGYHKDFTPIKLLCSWSKTINVTYITMTDTRSCDQAPGIKQKIISTLTNKIEETNGQNSIDLPYIETISKHFSSRVMKNHPVNKDKKSSKPQISPRKTTGNLSPTNNSRSDGLPQYLDSLARLRNSPRGKEPTSMHNTTQSFSLRSPQSSHNTSQSFSLRSPKAFSSSIGQTSPASRTATSAFTSPKGSVYNRERSNERLNKLVSSPGGKSKTMGYRSGSKEKVSPLKSASKTQPVGQMSSSLNHKLSEIKKKMQEIMSTPMERWSKTDSEFMKMATEDEMLELLQNL